MRKLLELILESPLYPPLPSGKRIKEREGEYQSLKVVGNYVLFITKGSR